MAVNVFTLKIGGSLMFESFPVYIVNIIYNKRRFLKTER